MRVHLGTHRLLEAGFQLEDFIKAKVPVREFISSFGLDQILKCDPHAYPLSELIYCVSPSTLRTVGDFSASDFLSLGFVSCSDLRQFGFSADEISEARRRQVFAASPLPERQPPNAATMAVGESWTTSLNGDGRRYFNIKYSRVAESEANNLLSHPHSENFPGALATPMYPYDGTGKRCPRCGQLFVLLEKEAGADDMCAEEKGKWICDDPTCGLVKEEDYKGYGTIF